MRRLAGIIFSLSSQQSYSFHSVWNNSLYCEPQGQTASTFPSRGEGKKRKKKKRCECALSIFFLWQELASGPLKTISDMKGDVLYLKMYIKWCQQHPRGQSRVPMETESGCCAQRPDTPPWVAALWWLSVSLVMSLAALTQVICMQADSAWDVRQRQWCTYHFPHWLIEDCNLCWTFSLITHVSGSKTRTLSCHWALGSSRAFSLQEDWSPPLRWAQFSSHLHYCYKCRIECI